jgi:hypothetical protein
MIAQGGRMEIESRLGGGTIVSLFFFGKEIIFEENKNS